MAVKMLFQSILILLVFFIQIVSNSLWIYAQEGDSQSVVDDIIKKLEKHEKNIIGTRFSYHVTTSLIDTFVIGTPYENKLIIREREEEFATLPSNTKVHPLPLVSWIVRSNEKGRVPVASFFVYDGKNYYRFLRGKPLDVNLVPVNFGLIDAGYNNSYLVENTFERILFMKLNGSSMNLDSIMRSKSSTKYRYVKDIDYLGYDAKEFVYESVPGQIKHITTVVTKPECMVVNFKIFSIPNNEVIAEYHIDEIGYSDGLYYPCRGGYTELESKREYLFNVFLAKKLSNECRETWIPQWPGGTDVRDIVSNAVFTVERTPEEIINLMEIRPKTPQSMSNMAFSIKFFLFTNGILLIALAIYIKIKRKKRGNSETKDSK